MHFKIILLLTSILGLASAAAYPEALPEAMPDAEAEAEALAAKMKAFDAPTSSLEERAPLPLEKRACSANGCTCKKVKQGQYCGSCQQVLTYGKGGSILYNFECNKNGGCCSYGKTKKCETYSNAIKYCPA